MDTEKMVEDIKKAVSMMKAHYGAVKFFAITRDSADLDKWSVIVSASWLDALTESTATMLITTFFSNNLQTSTLNKLARINVKRTDDSLIESLTQLIKITGEPVDMDDCIGKGIFINKMIVFESVRAETIPTISSRRSNRNELNPFRNPSINIYRNPNINPFRNPNINPFRNPNINPFRNPNINPFRNPNINKFRNPSINIYRNPNINPHRSNHANPRSAGFDGLYSYDKNMKSNGFMVSVSPEIYILFKNDFSEDGIAVASDTDVLTTYDKNNNWTGQLVRAYDNIYLVFNNSNEHIGYAADIRP